MRPIILHLAYHLTLAVYPGERQMYVTLRCEYHGPNMSTDVYNTVIYLQYCPKWVENSSINVSYNCFHEVAYWNVLQLTSSVHYCEQGQVANLW